MQIETTIEAMERGVCLFSTDVTVSVDYTVDDNDNVLWRVDEYIVQGDQCIWRPDGTYTREKVRHSVPEYLSSVFDRYLNKQQIEDEIIERLLESGEICHRDCSARMLGDYHARVF